MILVDPRNGGTDKDISGQLVSLIRRQNILSDKCMLDSGDFAFEGNGPNGVVPIGIERKTLKDMMHCIHDARYNQQRIEMKQQYAASVLILEGMWKPHDESGLLMQGYGGGASWGYFKLRNGSSSRSVLYSELYRYLIGVSLSGVIITLSRDLFHTAYNVCQWWHYFQKPWTSHTSLLETQKLAIPSLTGKPSLTRLWAADIDGIGVKFSAEAQRVFKTPIRLANSDEMDWLGISGIGVQTARSIIEQIHGFERR